MADADRAVELLARQPQWTTLAMAGHEWRHHGRLHAAFDRTMPAAAATATATMNAGSVDHDEGDAAWRIWLARPGKARAEYALGTDMIAVVVDGPRWWSWSPLLGPRSGGPELQVGLGPGWALLAGPSLLSVLGEFKVTGQRVVANRSGVTVEAEPLGVEVDDDLDTELALEMPAVSAGMLLSEIGVGADSYELTIDEELGIVLRVESRLAGEPFRVCEVVDLSVDQAVPPELLTLTPPGVSAAGQISA